MRQHKSPPSRPPRTCVRSSVPSASLRRPEPEPDDHGRRLLELPFAVRQTGAHVVPGRSWRSPARHLGRSSCSPPPHVVASAPDGHGSRLLELYEAEDSSDVRLASRRRRIRRPPRAPLQDSSSHRRGGPALAPVRCVCMLEHIAICQR